MKLNQQLANLPTVDKTVLQNPSKGLHGCNVIIIALTLVHILNMKTEKALHCIIQQHPRLISRLIPLVRLHNQVIVLHLSLIVNLHCPPPAVPAALSCAEIPPA